MRKKMENNINKKENENNIYEYLSFVAPVDYENKFYNRSEIYKFIKDNNDNKVLDINEIVDFVFFYNEKLYKMTKFGIEEV